MQNKYTYNLYKVFYNTAKPDELCQECLTEGEVESAFKYRARWRFNGGCEPDYSYRVERYKLVLDDADFDFKTQWK